MADTEVITKPLHLFAPHDPAMPRQEVESIPPLRQVLSRLSPSKPHCFAIPPTEVLLTRPPPSTSQDFRDYFDAEEDEAARRQQPKSYAHLGALREDSKAKYVFDRTSHTRKGSLAAHLR